jgi:hypothetical protein
MTLARPQSTWGQTLSSTVLGPNKFICTLSTLALVRLVWNATHQVNSFFGDKPRTFGFVSQFRRYQPFPCISLSRLQGFLSFAGGTLWWINGGCEFFGVPRSLAIRWTEGKACLLLFVVGGCLRHIICVPIYLPRCSACGPREYNNSPRDPHDLTPLEQSSYKVQYICSTSSDIRYCAVRTEGFQKKKKGCGWAVQDVIATRYFIAEPLGLATQENIDFGLFCYKNKQGVVIQIGHRQSKV